MYEIKYLTRQTLKRDTLQQALAIIKHSQRDTIVQFHALLKGQNDQVVGACEYNSTINQNIIPLANITELYKMSQQYNCAQPTSQNIGNMYTPS
jgi:hypothetical protein